MGSVEVDTVLCDNLCYACLPREMAIVTRRGRTFAKGKSLKIERISLPHLLLSLTQVQNSSSINKDESH